MSLIKTLSHLFDDGTVECKFCHKTYKCYSIGAACGCAAIADMRMVKGWYGSAVADETELYWTQPPPTTGLICDTCLRKFLVEELLTYDTKHQCEWCKKIVSPYYVRTTTRVSIYQGRQYGHWPTSAKWVNKPGTFYWCKDCGKPRYEKLEHYHLQLFEELVNIHRQIGGDAKFYHPVLKQMKRKQEVMKIIKLSRTA